MRALATLLFLLIASLTAAQAEGVFGFDGGPRYRGATRQSMICTEMVGATVEQNAEMKAFCEAEGFKWTGRDNWTARAHRKQAEIDRPIWTLFSSTMRKFPNALPVTAEVAMSAAALAIAGVVFAFMKAQQRKDP
jgi:hypothetical protein